MFVPDADMEKNFLRQADILEEIPFPLLDLKSLPVLGLIRPGKSGFQYPMIDTMLRPHRTDPHYFTGQVPMRLSFCAVLSHCCETEARDGKLLPPAFTLARLIKIKQSILENQEKLASLRANKDPRGTEPGYLDYFYIEAHERLGSMHWMVDFSQIVCIPNSEFPDILKRKILQMEDRDRVKFKIKLATYLGRITDEEDAAGIREPWA